MCKFFLIRQNRSSNQRSSIILEVQLQNSAQGRQSYHFQKIPRGPNINLFFENWHEAFFYIKEQKQKYKFKIGLLKSTGTILDTPKRAILVFEENPPKKYFSSCFGFDSALKTIDTPKFFCSVFLKTHIKSY